MSHASTRAARAIASATILASIIALGGCGQSEAPTSGSTSSNGTTAPAGLFADRSIAEGETLAGIGEVKKSAQAGETVKFVACSRCVSLTMSG
ncbi:MAG: hypothetical protein ACO3ZY_11170, partial [Phycisphaerales bacterium]